MKSKMGALRALVKEAIQEAFPDGDPQLRSLDAGPQRTHNRRTRMLEDLELSWERELGQLNDAALTSDGCILVPVELPSEGRIERWWRQWAREEYGGKAFKEWTIVQTEYGPGVKIVYTAMQGGRDLNDW